MLALAENQRFISRITSQDVTPRTHKKLDAAVAAAYGRPADLTDEQILERLLALNLERAGVGSAVRAGVATGL